MAELLEDVVARERLLALDSRVDRSEIRIDTVLEGFPQLYALKAELDGLRTSVDAVARDHVQNKDLEAFKTEYRNAHSDMLQNLNDLRTNVAVGPAEIRSLARSEAQREGRQQGVQQITTNMIAALVALSALGGALIGHFLG